METSAILLQALVGRGWGSQENGGEVVLARLAQVLFRLLDWKIGDQHTIHSGMAGHFAELREAHAQDGIEIGKDDQADGLRMLANLGGQFQHVLERGAVLQSAFAGALDHGTIGERIAEWNAEFDHARAGVDGGEDDLPRGGEIRIAAGYVGDEGRLVFEVEGHEGIVDCRSQIAEVEDPLWQQLRLT